MKQRYRQSNYIVKIATQSGHKTAAGFLNGIGSRFALPLARRKIRLNFGGR